MLGRRAERAATVPVEEPGRVLPAAVATAVRSRFDADDLRRFALADVDPSGRFAQTWAVLADGHLVLVEPDAEPRALPLDNRVELDIVEGTGGGRFRVVRDGRLAEELRFSRRQAKRFSALLHAGRRRIGAESEDSVLAIESADDEKLCESCGRLIPEWADSCPRCLRKRRILGRLLGYARPHRRLQVVGLTCAVLIVVLQLVPPVITRTMVDRVLTPGPEQRPGWLWPLIGLLALVIVLRLAAGYLRLNRMAQLSERITHDLRTQTFNHMQKLSLSYFNRKSTGNLITRITSDTDRLWDFIAFGLVDALTSVLTIVGVCVVMFATAPVLALLTLLPIPVGFAVTYLHIRAMRRILPRLWRRYSRMTGVLGDVIPGERVVKAFTQEGREISRFDRHSQAVVDDAMRLHREWTRYWPKVTLLLNLGSLVIWAYAGPRILGESFSIGTLVMFLGLVWMFYGPIEHLGMMNRMFQRALTSAQRIFEVLDTVPEIRNRPVTTARPRLDGSVTFEHVSFSYDGVKRVLHDVSFHVDAGEVIGLAGPSGGGKTTLVNLLCRFYDPTEGRILIDGVDLRDYDLHQLRSQIGIVLQEPYLFRGTVAQNIAYGRPDSTMEQIIEAARAANAHDFILGFPDAYDTQVGERGQSVSGGERQRLSIARAVLNDPRILIFDEATSSVDSKTELKIQQAIDRLVEGRTTFAIAHRLSTLRRAARLLILDKGRLAEQGTHDQLLAADGLYAKLHNTQAELHALFAV